MEMHEVKDAVDDLGQAFEAFKLANDARLAEVAKKGAADPLLDDKLAKLNGRFDRIETALNRGRGSRGLDGAENKAEPTPEAQAFFSYVRHGKDAMAAEQTKALTVGDDTAAGFLAPAEFVQEILRGATEFSPIRAVARVRQTARSAAQFPKRTGQFGAIWVAEQGTRAETTGLTYGLEEIPVHEMYALVDISLQLLEDSAFNLEQELQGEFSEQFAVTEGAALVSGDGAGKPEGILDNTAVGETVSGSATTIADSAGQANGLLDLFHDLKTVYANAGTWLLNRSTLGEVRKLKDGQNNYVWMPGLASGVANTILGQPYLEVPDMPNEAAGAFPIAFGDFRRGYVIADRINMAVLRDPYTQATSGNIRFIARRRVGGQVVISEAIRKLKCSA